MAAVTAVPDKAADWGITPDQIFSFDSGIGGRYSLWSAVGLGVMAAIGTENFEQLLAGAYDMDIHFTETPFAKNIPVLMGLLRLWHRHYMGAASYGLMIYDQRLSNFPKWIQQLEMESNGKGVDINGRPLNHPAAPLIWGGIGTGCQHSFFQWLHQGVEQVPIDILVPRRPSRLTFMPEANNSHNMLVASALAQAESLALGYDNQAEPHRHFSGNRPSILVSWQQTAPYHLGRLLALYEHITVVSGFLWGVNSFDQWGVELGKQMTDNVMQSKHSDKLSPAARAFIAKQDED